jgi:hypothetical protein
MAGGPSASAGSSGSSEQAAGAAAVAASSTGGVTAADEAAGEQSDEDDDGTDSDGDEEERGDAMSAFVEQVYHYAMAVRARVDDYEEMHEMVEQCPPPSREAVDASAAGGATDADVREAIATAERTAVVSGETGEVDESLPETVASHSAGVPNGRAPDEARYAFDLEPPQEQEAGD